MGSFDKYSNYNENTGFSSVVFGSGKPVLEVELNEMQQILNTKISRLIKVLGNYVTPLSDGNINFNKDTQELTLTDCVVLEKSGFTFYVKSATTTLDSENKYAYFKVEEVDLDSKSSMREYGNELGDLIPNPMKDNRSPAETSRRKVIKYSILNGSNIPENTDTLKYVLIGEFSDGEFFISPSNLTYTLNYDKDNSELQLKNGEDVISTVTISGGSTNVVENLLATPYVATRDQSSGSINASITDMQDGSLNVTAMFMQVGTVSASGNAIHLKAGTYTFSYTKKVEEGYQEFTSVGAILTFFDDADLTINYTGEFEGLIISESENLQASVGSVYLNNVGPSDTFTIEKDAYIQCHFNIFQMATNVMCDVSIYPMLESGSSAHDFVPYKYNREVMRNDIDNVQDVVGSIQEDIDSIQEDYTDTTVNVGRKADTTVGEYSSAIGYNNTVSENYSTAIGYNNDVKGRYNTALGAYNETDNYYSTAIGMNTIANNYSSYAEGEYTKASGCNSHAAGIGTEALDFQYVIGYYNNTKNANNGDGSAQSSGTLFCIGSGSEDSPANAFRVTGTGATIAKKAYSTSGADYAEFFEWLDGNPDNEDRRGYFVTLDGLKIKKANAGDYILGVVSALPSVIGNYDEEWKGRYILDDFGAFITETFECTTTVFDKETGEEKEVTKQRTKWKENPDYDKTKDYTPREERQEWDTIGLLGVIVVQDDGTCEVNGYCKCSDGGVATSAKVSEFSYLTPIYKVVDRVNDNLVKILLR